MAFGRRCSYDLSRADARPWLYGIATNLCTSIAGPRSDVYALTPGSPMSTGRRATCPTNLDPELAAALLELSHEERSLMFLLAWADFTYEQLAEALDVPVGTVRSRVSRVRSKLSAHLTRPDANAEAAEASGEWVGMNELDRLRRAYDAIDAPSEVAVATARELLRSEIEGANPVGNGLPRHEPPERRRAHRRRGRALVALVAGILLVGLLVTPTVGIGGRLLALIESAPARPDVQAPVWSPDGGRIAFFSKRDGNKESTS